VTLYLHTVRLIASVCVATILSVASPAGVGLAQTSEGAGRPAARATAPSQRAVTPRAVRVAPSRSGRAIAPRAGRFATPRSRRIVTPSRRIVTPRRQIVTPRAERPLRRVAPRIVTPRARGRVVRKDQVSIPRVARQSIRKAPANLALLNRGLRRNPGQNKPAHLQHDAKRKAGKSGWGHRHRPFFFKHAGHHWRRHYYSFPVGGLWYWYWYDVEADSDVIIYADAALPDCDLETDECIEPEAALVAPAILEGRATEEDMARCAARFRSFDTETGTYVTFGGEVRVCPYLE